MSEKFEGTTPLQESKEKKYNFEIENNSTYTSDQIEKIIKYAEGLATKDREGGSVIEALKIFDPVYDKDPQKGSAPGECQIWVRGGGSGPMVTFNIGKDLNLFPDSKEFWNDKQ